MPTKPLSQVRTANFLGLNDDLALQAEDGASSTLTNGYKKRRSIVRRKGQSALGSAALSPDQSLKLLEWTKIDATEHLIAVHDGSVVDFLDADVGAIVPNGEDRLPGSGSLDANAAWVEGHLVIGNGTDDNVRYKGGTGSGDLAADFNGTNEYLSHTSSANYETGDLDFTLAAWVYLDDLSADVGILTKWDEATSSQREYRLYYDTSSNKFKMGVWQYTLPAGGEAEANDGSAITTGQWYYVVGWHDSVNNLVGVQVNNATAVTSAYSTGITANSVDFNIGRWVGSSALLEGRIQRAGFWRSAGGGGGVLSSGLKTSLYNSGDGKAGADLTAGEEVALIRYWDLAGSPWVDSVTGSENLTDNNTVGTAEGVDYNTAIAQQMVDPPSTAPTLNVDFAGSDTHPATADAPELFTYKLSFLNADGEPSEAGPEVATATITQGFDIAVQNIPQPTAGQDASGIRIWRKFLGSTVFQLVADVPVGTTNYVDAVLNADLGEDLVEGNTAFPPCQYFSEWNGRLVGAGNAADPQLIAISNYQEHFYSPESPDLDNPNQGSRARLQGRAAGKVTGLRTHGGVVAIFTGGAGYLLRGDQPQLFSVQQFTANGCVAHRTIVSSKNLLLWLSVDGVYAWESGGAVTRVSDDVRTTLEAMTASEMAGAHAVVFEDRYYLFWATGALVYDLQYRIWSSLSNNTWRDAAASEFVESGRARLWGAYEGQARVYQLETGATDAIPTAGTAITMTWASRDWDMGQPGRDKRVHWVETKFKKATGTATITLYRGTGESIQTLSHNVADVTESSGETVSRKLQSAVEQARSEHFRVKVEIGGTDATCELLAAGLMYSLAS